MPIVGVAIVLVILGIIYRPITNLENDIEKRIQEITEEYKKEKIILSEEDITVRDNQIIITNEEKAQQHKNALNQELITIKHKYVPWSNSSTTDGASSSEDEGSGGEDTPSPDTPDQTINDLFNLAYEKINQTNALWNYFNNSKYIDMNTGLTYDDIYNDDAGAASQTRIDIIVKVAEEHPDWSSAEVITYVTQHRDELGYPDIPEYDESMIDIDTSQINKAYGLLAPLKIPENNDDATRTLYADSLANYMVLYDIGWQDDLLRMTFANRDYPYKEFLSKQIYKQNPTFDTATAILEETNDYTYDNNVYVSAITIKTGQYALIYGINLDGSYMLLDIQSS